jgi:hypothetical protein
MKVKYIQCTTEKLINNKEYDVIKVEDNFFVIKDELNEETYWWQDRFIVTQI